MKLQLTHKGVTYTAPVESFRVKLFARTIHISLNAICKANGEEIEANTDIVLDRDTSTGKLIENLLN